MSPAKQSIQTTGIQHWAFRIQCSIAVILALAFPGNRKLAAQDFPTPTLSYQAPATLTVGDAPIDLKDHVTTRFFDWDQDSDLDLLAGGGDGKLWLFQNTGTAQHARFASKQPIVAGTRNRWGSSYTGVLLANLIGDPLLDLVVSHSGNQVTIHENIGKNGTLQFAERGVTFEVQKNCQGRFDAADWDGDGTVDLITGSFGGKLQWHPNLGTTDSPKFGSGESFYSIQSAYNAHPRIIDFNQDGRLDLLLGNNWGSVTLYLNQSQDELSLRKSKPLLWSDGSNLNIREINGDDTTPELADLDHDGVLDLISGGKNGQVFWMRGIGLSSRVAQFKDLLKTNADKLGERLSVDDDFRKQVFGLLASMQSDLAGGLIPREAAAKLFSDLAPLANQHAKVLTRQKFDVENTPYLPMLAAQYWVVLKGALPDSIANRKLVADAIGFEDGYRRLLVDFGVLFIDNNMATREHLATMHQLMTAMPRDAWDVETITVAGWLGAGIKTQKIRSRSGINIFDLPLGRTENSFPQDSPRAGVTDVYLICLAHELAHNMLDTVGRKTRPDLFEAKFAGLSQAAGSDVIFKSPKSKGIDFPATKKNFQKLGLWDGVPENWKTAWDDYFKNKEQFDRSYARGNVKFFLDAPQEAFATLANQYFANSQLMLDFCKTRWDAGHRSNINQFILIADYLSGGNDEVPFYTLRPGGGLRVTTARLTRDEKNRITSVQSPSSIANFKYADQVLVGEFELAPLKDNH